MWAYLYAATDRMPRDALFAKVRREVERLDTHKLRDAIAALRPDHIVRTHFLPAELLAHEIRRGRLALPVWVQVTDFDLHRRWVQPGMRGYFAASDEIAHRMVCAWHPAWVFPFIALAFHLPAFLVGTWSWRLEARAIASIMLFWVIEDLHWVPSAVAIALIARSYRKRAAISR